MEVTIWNVTGILNFIKSSKYCDVATVSFWSWQLKQAIHNSINTVSDVAGGGGGGGGRGGEGRVVS